MIYTKHYGVVKIVNFDFGKHWNFQNHSNNLIKFRQSNLQSTCLPKLLNLIMKYFIDYIQTIQ